jgi:hypothetical protein
MSETRSVHTNTGQTVRRLGSETLVRRLGRRLGTEAGGQLSELAKGGVQIGQPAEGEGLHEGGAGELAGAAEESARRRIGGVGGEDRLEGVGTISYTSGHRKLRTKVVR